MTTTEKMFKFPIRIYDPLQSEALIDEFNNLHLEPELKWVRGWKKIFFEDIIDIGDSFFRDVPIDEVIETGFKSSTICTQDYHYRCDWPLSVLERKLDQHIDRVQQWENSQKPTTAKLKVLPSKNSSDNIALTS